MNCRGSPLKLSRFLIISICLLLARTGSAQDPVATPSTLPKKLSHEFELNVDLDQYCQEEKKKQEVPPSPNGECTAPDNGAPKDLESLTRAFKDLNGKVDGLSVPETSILAQKNQSCLLINQLGAAGAKPYTITQKDNAGNTWKIRFSFGDTRTHYFNSDVHIQDSRINVVIKDAQFTERTSAQYYNPKNWTSLDQSVKWIDEPTNTFLFSAEKGNNVFYLSIFHPKFLINNQDAHVTGVVDGVAVDKVMPIDKPFDGYDNKPGEMHLTRFQNTHMQMDWEIGYGRKFVIFSGKKSGTLSYTPAVSVGITSGEADDLYLKKGAYWDYDEVVDKNRIQGVNISASQRLEYQRGRVSVFVDQKYTHSELKHGFMDGTATYSMNYMPISFGVGFTLFDIKQKRPDAPPPAGSIQPSELSPRIPDAPTPSTIK